MNKIMSSVEGILKPYLNQSNLIKCALICIITYYNLFTNFKFLPITEGWFSSYAQLILNGQVPYRDFYLYLTPLYVWIISLITYVFGTSIFVLRIFGLLIICVISLLLFAILKRRFSSTASFIGVVIAVIYYQSGNAHITYDFTQVLTLFTLAGCLFLIMASEAISLNNKKLQYKYLFFSGLFSSLVFLTKQSNGAFIAIGISCAFLLILYTKKIPNLIKLRSTYFFLAGIISPLILLCVYLLFHGALIAFIDQIFFNAIQAKGNLVQILSNWISGVFTNTLRIQILEIAYKIIPAIIVSHLFFWLIKKRKGEQFLQVVIEKYREITGLVIFFTMYVVVIYFAWNDNIFLREKIFPHGRELLNYIIPFEIFWVTLVILFQLLHIFYKSLPSPNHETVLLAIVNIGMIFGNGTSAGLSEISAFIALSWGIAWLIHKNSIPFFGIWYALWLTLLLSTTFAYKKFDKPYSWWGVNEPSARVASYSLESNLLNGIYVSEQTSENFKKIVFELETTNASDSILSFPSIPMIYLLSNRWPETKALIGWFDFLNDKDAILESERISIDPPKTIVYLKLPEVAWLAHERLFRNGNSLGQRKILEQIEKICALNSYHKSEYLIDQENGTSLVICKIIK
jgi:4-amino-4-deoxy-L-arabinose transferase-like glycosyltransferase